MSVGSKDNSQGHEAGGWETTVASLTELGSQEREPSGGWRCGERC